MNQIQLLPLRNGVEMRVVNVLNNVLRIQLANMAPLINARQKAVAPELRPNDWLADTTPRSLGGSGFPYRDRRPRAHTGRTGCELPQVIISNDGS